jgi:GNAT superfamily N-acetyltransferase
MSWKVKTLRGRDFVEKYEGSDVYDRIDYLSPNLVYGWDWEETILYIEVKNKLVAAAGLQENPNDPEMLWMKFISVDSEFRNMGMATSLFPAVVAFAENKGYKKLKISSYEPDGKKFLKPVIDRYIGNTLVEIIPPYNDNDDW